MFFRRFLPFLLACLVSLPLSAATPLERAAVLRNLDELGSRELSKAEQQSLRLALEGTLQLLDQKADSEQRLAQLHEQLAAAPEQIRNAQRELARLQESTESDPQAKYSGNALNRLEQAQEQLNRQLLDWKQKLADASTLLVTVQTRPERAQAEISQAQTRTLDINNLLKQGKEQNRPLSAEQRNQLLTELAVLASRTQLRREELAGNSLLQDLGNARHDLYAERIRRAEQESLALQTLISEHRREQSERAVAELSREVQEASGDRLLARETSDNLKLSDYLLRITERVNQVTRKNMETQQQLDSLTQMGQALEEQIEVLQGSLLLSRILYQQKQALPKVSVDRRLADEIADIRLYQFEINQQRELLSHPEAFVERLLASQPAEQVTAELRSALLDLVATRNDLLERLNREMSSLLNASITLQLNQKQLQSTSTGLRATLEEQMFWIPSNKPIDHTWLRNLPQAVQQQIADLDLRPMLHDLGEGLLDRPLLFLPLLLLVVALLWRRNWLLARLEKLHQDLGQHKRDSQLHTPLALLLTLLLTLPGALLLSLAGLALQLDARGQNAMLGMALQHLALAWLMFYGAYRILAPGGVAEQHFRWPRAQVAFLRPLVGYFGIVVAALVLVVGIAGQRPQAMAEDSISICVVLVCYALMSWLTARLLLDHATRERTSAFRLILGLAITALPLVLFVAVGAGYYYTALKLTGQLIDTVYLLMLWLVLEATFVRGLNVAALRLVQQRAQSKRQAQEVGEGEVVEEPTLDIEQVNQQSLRLIRLALLSVFAIALYWVWADLISAFSYLDNITLYQYTGSDGSTQVPLSLADLIVALLTLALTIVLARNLPGLLEVLVLSRLSLAQGSAYATTSLLSYLIIGIGSAATLSTLGVSWDKLQWLVAALSLGIGFGLQAIFANFVSGLILLFERPLRIGDTVTIGGVTGTVHRIRIRATHITDGDRKEVIVPNQTFLTSQLINWTLSDSVTRIALTYNVNRGADLRQVRKLLLQAAEENHRVLRDPGPSVQLKTYGTGSLEHELKIYVRELGDRSPATDELNRRIDQLFEENGINLSTVPKMDVTVTQREPSRPTPEQRPE